jgi:hypothetical protein
MAWVRNGLIENVSNEEESVHRDPQDGYTFMSEAEAIRLGIPYTTEEPEATNATAAPVYLDPIEQIHLDASPAAQARFTSLVALIREGLDFGALTNDSKQEIRDVHGVTHSLSVLRIRALMLRYGLHCKALFDQVEERDGQSK